MADGFAAADKSKPYIGLNCADSRDRGYKDGDATATCFCGAVQLAFVSLAHEFSHDDFIFFPKTNQLSVLTKQLAD